MTNKAVFLDRDGTMARDVHYCRRPEDFELYPDTPKAIRQLNEHGFKVIVITNQSGIARGYFTEETLVKIHEKMKGGLAEEGAWVDAIYYCPHHPDDNCECRKPKPRLVLQAVKEYDIDLQRSFVVGDLPMDIGLAKGVGSKSVLIRREPSDEHIDFQECAPDYTVTNLGQAADWILGQSRLRGAELVTIVLPTRNRAYCVGNAIDSILAQTYSNWELIIVDGASTDNTPLVAQSYSERDRRIRYHRRFPRQGLPRDRNIGVSLSDSRSRLVYFIEDDLIMEPDCLEVLVSTIIELRANDSKVGGIAPRTINEFGKEEKLMELLRYVGDQKRRNMVSPSLVGKWTGMLYANYALSSGSIQETKLAPSWSLFFKEVLNEVGGYEEQAYKKVNYFYEESDLHLRIGSRGYKIYFQPKAVAYHRHAATGGTRVSAVKYYRNFLVAHFTLLIRIYGWKTLYMYPCFLFSVGYNFVRASVALLRRGIR